MPFMWIEILSFQRYTHRKGKPGAHSETEMPVCTCQEFLVVGHKVQNIYPFLAGLMISIYITSLVRGHVCGACLVHKQTKISTLHDMERTLNLTSAFSAGKKTEVQQVSKITEIYSCNAQNILTRYKILKHQVKQIE